MKFHTFAIVALLASKQVNSQTVTNGNFTFVGSYAFPSAKGAYLGGGSIVDDKLLLIVNAEEIDSYLGSVPVLRNSTTGRITGFDFASITPVLIEPELEQLSQMANFVGEKYVYSTTTDNDPYSMSFADKTFTDITRIENIPSLNIRDSATGELFQGPYGVDFSPVITDPGTGIGKIMCTSIESFWEVALQLNDSTTPSKWEIASATKLAELAAYYAGGYSFIPSGSNKHNIFFADWDNSIVKMMKFDAAGRPVVPTQTTDFITGIDRPWGFFFDPKTKDFFVSTWDASPDGLVQFKGFPPGLDTDVVIDNIKNEMQVAATILLSGRRKLKLKSNHGNLRRLREDARTKAKAKVNPCDKANPHASFGLQMAGKNCDGAKEVEIPESDDIASDLLNYETGEEASEYFGSLLDETVTNDSFTEDVLSGESSDVFEENIEKLITSVELVLEEAANSGLSADNLVLVQDSLNKVKELLTLLAGVVEGSGE